MAGGSDEGWLSSRIQNLDISHGLLKSRSLLIGLLGGAPTLEPESKEAVPKLDGMGGKSRRFES